mgnify:CR=1 FL=1
MKICADDGRELARLKVYEGNPRVAYGGGFSVMMTKAATLKVADAEGAPKWDAANEPPLPLETPAGTAAAEAAKEDSWGLW